MLVLDLLRRLILRVAELELVGHRRRGGDEVEVIFARQPLLNDLEVEQAQTAAAEAEAQCRRAFHLEREARIVQPQLRSEEHTSELQSLMRNSYAVFCLK